MAKRRSKRLFPRKMSSDFINTYKGVDKTKVAAFDVFKNHERTKSLQKTSVHHEMPSTQYVKNKHLIFTPRVKALAQAHEARAATPDISSVSIGERMVKVSTWNKFRVAEGLWLYFQGQQWVFVKESRVSQGEILYSTIYPSKEAALRDIRIVQGVLVWSKIFWAGERKV